MDITKSYTLFLSDESGEQMQKRILKASKGPHNLQAQMIKRMENQLKCFSKKEDWSFLR